MNEQSEIQSTGSKITTRRKRKFFSKSNQDDSKNTSVEEKQKISCKKVKGGTTENDSEIASCLHENSDDNEEKSGDVKDISKGTSHGSCDKCSYCADHCPQPNSEVKKKFNCNSCKFSGVRRSFATAERLESHINSCHVTSESKLLFTCQECETPPLAFKSKAKYLYHLGAKHPGAVYFVCEICTATFKMKANYRDHMATHNIVSKKPFSCEVCKATFVNKAGYEAHRKRFPGPHMKHVCPHCNFSFSKESHIRNHRCKKLLLEEGAARATQALEVTPSIIESSTANSSEQANPQVFRQQTPVTVAEPVVIQGLQASGAESLILRDLGGQVLPGSQVLQFDLTDSVDQTQQVYHVNVADWNMVAPFVIRDPNSQMIERPVE